jgi:predicted transcriptional regulator
MVDGAGSSAQRIRIGLTGLAVAFLLVLLGSAVSRYARDDAGNAVQQQTSANGAVDEPLAELGVAPGTADSPANNSVSN